VIETARELKCSEGTVKSQTAKGISRLRDLLDGSGPPVRPVTAASPVATAINPQES
jgi:hypothetical protein